MKNLTLKQLRYFDALARFGHFGRAADALSISQPALSLQIKDLEQSVGTALFERSARKVGLTGFGHVFAGRVQAILQSVDELEDLARAARDTFTGRLRLGVIPTIAPYLLPRLMPRLSEAFRDLDVHIRETLTSRLIEELAEGRIDAAIVALPVSEPAFEEVTLFSERLVLVRPETERDGAPVTVETLRDMRLLLLEEGHCFREQALSFCNLGSGARRDGLEGSSLSTLVQMVGAGLGVTFIPEMAIDVETRSAAVVVDRLTPSEPSRTVGMIWRRTSPIADQLGRIARIVRASAPASAAPAAGV